MAKFETIVRPVVFPNIRPSPARTLLPDDSSDEGVVIRGNPAKSYDLSYSYSFSASSASSQETQREVDEVRVYQEDDDGNINRDNFVDIDVAKKLWLKGPRMRQVDGRDPSVSGGESGPAISFKPESYTRRYKPVDEDKKNVEVRNRDQIKKNPESK